PAHPLLVGRPWPDRRPRPHAAARTPRVSVAALRAPPDLRRGGEHGRPGDAPPGRPSSAPAGGRRGVRRAGEHGPPLPRLPRAPARPAAPADGPLRDRRLALGLAAALRGAEPACARAPDRALRR